MRKTALPLLFLALSMPMFAQTTKVYTQQIVLYSPYTNNCYIAYCVNKSFLAADGSQGTLSYTDSIQYFGNQTFTGTLTWNDTEYTDFTGHFTALGYIHYPYFAWTLEGTADNGNLMDYEVFTCYRSGCWNSSGTMTVTIP
jgi:hypothetical protein